MAISSPREANRVPSLVSVSSADGTTPVNPWTDPTTHRLLVDASVTIAANSSVNINQFGGTSVTLGQKAMTASMPVVLASDQASIPVAATLSAETTKVIGTINIAAAQTIAVTNAGTFAVQATLQTGSNQIGHLEANQSVNVAQVNGVAPSMGNGVSGTGVQRVTIASDSTGNIATIGTSITPGTGATNLGKAEDAAHSSGDVGVMALAVRNDAGTILAGSDGDYVPVTTDATGALRIDMNGSVSANNSSTATLTSGSVFTGTSDDALNYNEIRVGVISNVASATDGLSIQQSSDNTNWDITDTYTIPAATGKTYAVPRQARYVRIVYTNGGTNQASFRLQTILNRIGTMASSQRSSDAYTNETDLEQVWAFNSVYNGTTWDRIREAVNALNSTGTGLQTAQIIGQFDDVSPTSITENQFGNVRMSANRNLYGTIRDAAGNERGANVNSSNQLSVSVDNSNVSTNIAQMNGVTVTMGNGISGTGVQRVTIASDSTGQVTLAAGANTIGSLSANQSVNVAQMNGVTVTMNNGAAGTGVQRVTLASDSTGNIATIGTSITPGTAAANLGKAEDAAHASGDTGVAVWGVRNDNLATTYGADQDYGPLATDLKGRVMVAQKAATGTLTNVTASASSGTVLAANSARIGATITNDSSALLYLKFGATASTTSYTVVLAGAASAPFSYYEVPAGYTGIIDGIWASATGNARVTEIT